MSGLVWWLEVDDAVAELFGRDGADGVDQRFASCGSAGESGRDGNHEPGMVTSGVEMLGGDPREVRDVLGQHDAVRRDRGGEHTGVGATGDPEFCNGARVDPGSSQTVGQGWRVHLVDE